MFKQRRYRKTLKKRGVMDGKSIMKGYEKRLEFSYGPYFKIINIISFFSSFNFFMTTFV